MALNPGLRVGAYEVGELIGSGGMGEVYRATDTNLSRQVAIKVLPDALASDAERLARFDREARTLAALNHPNIAAIYGVERAGTTSALVMELVEGPTLADRIEQGPIPLDEALPIALQIARALEGAHEQGIVHRDLKPANIKVRPDGTVKVLDFGLAKALGPDVAGAISSSVSLSPTITSPAMMTSAGIILGTAAYMSPEQARGRGVDKRADIWAFGAVLYEMLTGERAFQGEDVSDTLADVMRVEPAWAKLPGAVPPALTTFLQRCLRKNPAERIRDIGDVRLALEGAFDTIIPSAPTIAAAVPPPPLWRRMLPVGAAAVATAIAAGVAVWYLKPGEPREVVRLVHALPEGRAFRNAGRVILAVSPDGRSVLYNATGGLYLRTIDSVEDRLIPGTEEPLTTPTFSPDGQSIAFVQQNQLKRMPLSGGGATMLAPAENPLGISWEKDGTILFALPDGIWQVSENGGEPRRVLASQENGFYIDATRLPAGDWILATFFRPNATLSRGNDLVVVSPSTGEQRTLRSGASAGRYLATGHLIYSVDGVLYAVRFDPDRAAVVGAAVPVVQGVRRITGFGSNLVQYGVSSSGTLVFVPGPVGSNSRGQFAIVESDRNGTLKPTRVQPGQYVHVRATRDGARLAIDTDDGKAADIWIHEMAGDTALRRLTLVGRNRLPVWAPDGVRVAFQSDREGDLGIFVQRADGTGEVQRLTKAGKGEEHVPESWSPDGRIMSFSVLKNSAYSLWTVSVVDRKPVLFADLQSTEPPGSAFSTDGRWLAYHARPVGVSNPTSQTAGVFVRPFPAAGATAYQTPKVVLDFQPVWSTDGAELFYIPSVASGRIAAVQVTRGTGLTFGSPESLPFSLTAEQLSGSIRAFDVLPGGRFIGPGTIGDQSQRLATTAEIRVVVNWLEEVKRLVRD
jgi:serine/threonine-protein kinase